MTKVFNNERQANTKRSHMEVLFSRSNIQEEVMYHFKEEHRLRMQAEAALEQAKASSRRYQQMAKEYKSQIENLNALTHDFLCQRSRMEQVALEKNNIKTHYEEIFKVMEDEINDLKKLLHDRRVIETDKRVIVLEDKIQILEEENDILHEKLWRLKRKFVDKAVSTDDIEAMCEIAGQGKSLSLKYGNATDENSFGFSKNSLPQDLMTWEQSKSPSSPSSDSQSNGNSDSEMKELLNKWKYKSNDLAEQRQQLEIRLQQLESERISDSMSPKAVREFEYSNSTSTRALTIYSHDDEVFLPMKSSPTIPRSNELILAEKPPLEAKCAGISKPNGNINISFLAKESNPQYYSPLDNYFVNGRTVEILNSDDSYDPEDGLLNEKLYNLPDEKLIRAVRDNLIHIRIRKYGEEVFTQSAPGRVSLLDFVRDGGYASQQKDEIEAMDSFNFLKDLPDRFSEQEAISDTST